MQTEYHIKFKEIQNNISDVNLTFAISHMKCRTLAVVYFMLHCYDVKGDEIYSVARKPAYTSKRWVVDSSYTQYIEEFTLAESILDITNTTQIELVMIGVDDNNPLYFNQLMLTDKPFVTYHETDEAMSVAEIAFIKNGYVNLYNNKSENYLQVIRPSKKSFTTTLSLQQSVNQYIGSGCGKAFMRCLQKCISDEQCVYGPNYDPATGKTKHPHQRRVPNRILSSFLAKVKQLNPQQGQFKDFEEFFIAVCMQTGQSPSLLVYDFCLRKGYSIGLQPEDYVYLFRGAKEGYKQISGAAAVSFRVPLNSMRAKPCFNPIFTGYRSVTSAIVEDILCNYHQKCTGSIKPGFGCNAGG